MKTINKKTLLWATSDDAATNGDPGAFVLRYDVAWPDNVENDVQQKTAVRNWRQSPKTSKTKKIE